MTLTSSIGALSHMEQRIVGRSESMFAADLRTFHRDLRERIEGRRLLFIGAAGSIGSETLKTVVRYAPKTLHVMDHNENGLAELVRGLRSSPEAFDVADFMTLPFDYAGDPARLFLADQAPYDYVLNFAALKHVRSEKDPYAILAMLETNVAKLVRFSERLAEKKGLERLFCVSTDKAANPSSMMGATKRMMEHALFSTDVPWQSELSITSARFANVAFSNGSLLQSWEKRLLARQPLAVPEGCRRFFVTLPESGQLCTLAGFLGEDRNVFVPTLRPEEHLVLLQDVIVWFLQENGLEPHFTRDEDEARSRLDALSVEGKWPVMLTPLDTAGEKPYEEFVGENEIETATRFKSLNRVPYVAPQDPEAFGNFLSWLEAALSGSSSFTSDMIKAEIARVEASFARTHVTSAQSLDQRI